MQPNNGNRKSISTRELLALRLSGLGAELIAGAARLRATGDATHTAALLKTHLERVRIFTEAIAALEAGDLVTAVRLADLLAPFGKHPPPGYS